MEKDRLGHETTISTADAREQWADILNRAAYAGERIVIEHHGKPVAALVPLEDLEKLRAVERFQRIVRPKE